MELKGHLLYYPEGKHDINLDNYIQKSQLNDALKSKVDPITKTTYADLKNLRDNSKLVPGAFYRITDYNCTTTQENTRSAGHQFDIVLLALSADKLAEEGWAMEHPTDIYDITFTGDNVTKRCYLYYYYSSDLSSDAINVIDIETKLGAIYTPSDFYEINGEYKTARLDDGSAGLTTPNLTYNYFQNSNLSAWKVWYCLDNDTARFAWADDSVDEDSPAKIKTLGGRNYTFPAGATFIRDEQNDEIDEGSGITYYAWVKDNDNSTIVYTSISKPPFTGIYSHLYLKGTRGFSQANGNIVDNYTPAHEGTGLPNGRGVIYRLIDEFNNDVGYDFKNIQYVRKLTDGYYTPDNGTDTWVYTFSYVVDEAIQDGSLSHNYNNTIGPMNVTFRYKLNDIVSIDNAYGHVFNTFIGCKGVTIFDDVEFVQFFDCYNLQMNDTIGGIYINNKKVLTEE